MDPFNKNVIDLQIQLGRLVSACEAMPGVYHVQDASGALVPVMVVRKHPLRHFLRSWRLGLTVVVLGTVMATASGLYAWRRMSALPAPAAVALPIAQRGAAPAAPVSVVDAPYAPQAQRALAPDVALPLGPAGGGLPLAPPAAAAAAAPAPADVIPPVAGPVPTTPAPAAVPAAAAMRERAAQHVAAVAPVPMKPAPHAAVVQAPLPLPVAEPAAAAATVAVRAPAEKDDPTVFNEPAGRPAIAAAPAAPRAPAAQPPAKPGDLRVKLVAVKDAQTALLHLPGNPLPVQVKPGTKLPNGLTLTSADPVKGTVRFDNGLTLSLE